MCILASILFHNFVLVNLTEKNANMCKSYKFSCFKYHVVPWENLMGIDNYFYMGKMNHNIFDAYLYSFGRSLA